MAKLRFGTCSWKYDSWYQLVYSGPKVRNHLLEYCRIYDSVEIDQWFWSLFGPGKIGMPSAKTVDEYRRSVPEGFTFTIKVPNSITLTHYYQQDKSLPLTANPHFLSVELFGEFLAAIEPLGDTAGPLMFQFEYLNRRKMKHRQSFQEQFAAFLSRISRPCPLGIEIRNPNYLHREYFEFLREQRLGHVFLQGYYMPPVWEVYNRFKEQLAQFAVIRLHGPDRSDIEKKSGGNWSRLLEPKDEELQQIARISEELLERRMDVYINVNNHYEGSAPLT
ncbi:MAG: DUF72 domain-containing protein, partial [Calditrichia bacterium]